MVGFADPTGPFLYGGVGGGGVFRAQVVSAGTSVTPDGVFAPPGKTALLVRVKVGAGVDGATTPAPFAPSWRISYPACEAAVHSCRWVDDTSHLVAEDDARAGRTSPAVAGMSGTLRAGTAYFGYVWQYVPEHADLSAAHLCAATPVPGREACVALGPVPALSDRAAKVLDLSAAGAADPARGSE